MTPSSEATVRRVSLMDSRVNVDWLRASLDGNGRTLMTVVVCEGQSWTAEHPPNGAECEKFGSFRGELADVVLTSYMEQFTGFMESLL